MCAKGRKWKVIVSLSFLMVLFYWGLACATSASINVSGNEGAILLSASATFTSYKHCRSNDPNDCWYVNSGTLHVFQDGSLLGYTSGDGSAAWSTTLDGGGMSQGDHTFSATATDSEGETHTASTTITIDNTPEVSINSPGQVEGLFDITGSATFKEKAGGAEGAVYIYINGGLHGHKWYYGTDVSWSYSDIQGSLLDAGMFAQGEHTIEVRAYAANGADDSATETFTIDNTPEVSINSPGQVEGLFDITGSATFKEKAGGAEGAVYIYIDGGLHGHKWYYGTDVSWSYSNIKGSLLDASMFAQGEHTIEVHAYAANGADDSATETFTIDNTPEVSINSPGQVEGLFDITGSATFKERARADKGAVYIYIDGNLHGHKWYVKTDVSWSYSNIQGSLLDANTFLLGDHLIEVYAYAPNGAYDSVSSSFEVTELNTNKNLGSGAGPCPIRPIAGNPINFATGNKYQRETDLMVSGPGVPMGYHRYYNSQKEETGPLGYGWTGAFSESLTTATGKIILHQTDGNEVHFMNDGLGKYISEADQVRTIESMGGGYRLYEPGGMELSFDSTGKLFQVTDRNGNSQNLEYVDGRLGYVEDNFGRRLDFSYNENGRLATLSTPSYQFIYTYDGQGNLTTVTNPDTTAKIYLYEDPNDPHNLTGIINENSIRCASFVYDNQDRAVLSEKAGGVKRVEVSYDNSFVRHVTDSNGHTTDYTLQVEHGIGRIKSSTGEGCIGCSSSRGSQYNLDDRFWIQSSMDAKGNMTAYTYDARGNVLTKREAVGTAIERLTTHTYHPDYNLITSTTRESISSPGRTTDTFLIYDSNGNLVEKTEAGFSGSNPMSRTTTYTYNSSGRMTLIDGPRTDVIDITSYDYYLNDPGEGRNRGMLRKVTNPLGHETIFSQYNAFGKPEQSMDANNGIITFDYDALGRLTSRTTAGITTTSEYNDSGNLKAVYMPGGRTISYTYTNADLLEKIEDNLGRYILYSYDTEGNRTREGIHDSDGTLKKFTDFQFDSYNRLSKTIYPGNDIEERGYDLKGNLDSLTDANNNTTTYDYDALDRLLSVTQPGSIITGYTYDSHDNLVSVTDAEDNATQYTYDDLGRVITIDSPDTGTTTHEYEDAGNLILKIDAKGTTVTYTYDAANRLTGIHFPDSSQDITYTYDQGINGKGRLTGITDQSGTNTYDYDAFGRLIRETKSIEGRAFTMEYAYNANGEITSITYPSGRVVTYTRDITGQITTVESTYQGSTTTLAGNFVHLPFGPVTVMHLGNGLDITRNYDHLYRLDSSSAGSVYSRNYSFDPVGNITAINDLVDPSRTQSFGYDRINRLLSATGSYGSMSYTYDKAGNRLTKTVNSDTDTYNYETNSNRLLAITGVHPVTFTYDANGNITSTGARTLVYNQNNRLIRAIENSIPSGEYLYNGQGQRVKKVANEETILFVYSKDGDLITETDENGDVLKEYVYLEGARLTQFAYDATTEIEVSVTTSKGRLLEGINVYAFTALGSYTGISATTDDQGIAAFSVGDFTDGDYKFRADYLSYQFWSDLITVPGNYTSQVAIEEETAEITVTVAGETEEGVRVYVFNGNGSYLGIYGVTDADGKVSFDLPVGQTYMFRADYMGSQYWSDTTEITAGASNPVGISTGGGTLSVTVQKGAGQPLKGLSLYLFSPSGSYLGYYGQSDEYGQVSFQVSSGDYKVRADYLGYQFWTHIVSVHSSASYDLTIPHQDVTVTVKGNYGGDIVSREGLNAYLFTPAGSYLGQYQVTDAQGQVTFNLPQKGYKVRADYLSQQFFSDVFNWTDETITINEGLAEVTVTNMGLPLEGVNNYVFNESGSYLGMHDVTDWAGKALFRLPAGDYNFRADYMANQYWSGVSTIIAHVESPVSISTGGSSFTLEVLKDAQAPLIGISCYLFNESGAYLGEHGVTNSQGKVDFNLADGIYKIRVDYLGYQFWTEPFDVPGTSSLPFTIAHQDITVTVVGDYSGDTVAREGFNTYLFTQAGSYLGQYQVTDAQGQVSFNLPQKDYKARADYLSQQFFSDVFSWTDETITIMEGIAEVHVQQGSSPLGGISVYVFSSSGSYIGINDQTDEEGMVTYRLPEATYSFRGDHQGSQYWSTQPVSAHEVNVINLNTGGGTFTLTVEKEAGSPIANIPIYVFSSSGNYLGLSNHTDDQGQVVFDLSSGDYMFRADHLGYRFLTDVSSAPTTLSDVLTIPHQDVTITVNEVYRDDIEPLEHIRVYLFTSSGSYMGVYGNTDDQGHALFNLPQEDYKVRADYLAGQYWSDDFNWLDMEVDIDHGLVDVHVTVNGEEVLDAPIYLFAESGSYLGRVDRTDESGHAEFLLPSKSYKFRVDFDGTQYWSDVIHVIAHEEMDVSLALDQLALNSTNDPNPVRFDGTPPAFNPEGIRVASIGSLVGILSQSVVANTSSPKVYYYINDHLSTPQLMTDENGVVVWEAEYKPFGEASVQPSANVINNCRFPGQYYDSEIGLHYNYHRYYDPKTGRYLTPDPIGLEGGINLFPYAKNNPIANIDIDGRYVEVGTRKFFPIPVFIPGGADRSGGSGAGELYHCFVRFDSNNSDTLSFDNKGAHEDPSAKLDSKFVNWYYNIEYSPVESMLPPNKNCEEQYTKEKDNCVRIEMKKCKNYRFFQFNCCDCVRQALTNCGLQKIGPWPNLGI